jgi:hypothetical protein
MHDSQSEQATPRYRNTTKIQINQDNDHHQSFKDERFMTAQTATRDRSIDRMT